MIAPVYDANGTLELSSYLAFNEAKRPPVQHLGFVVPDDELPARAKPHQRDLVRWAVAGGRRAIFASFGLGKTLMGIETVHLTRLRSGGKALIVAPLYVARVEFPKEARLLGIDVKFIRSTEEIEDDRTIYLTNYESVREGKIDASLFTVVHLDEASVLRGLGTKTFREFYRLFQNTRFRFCASATPAPNDYIEILNYAMFLGVMDIGEAKTRFFSRNSERSDDLTLHPHKEEEFWLWVTTWAVFLQKPSDLGHSDAVYQLPKLTVNWHVVGADHRVAGEERDGQGRMFHRHALGLSEAAAARRGSIDERVAKAVALREARQADHVIIWHDRNDERDLIAESVDDCWVVSGEQPLERREDIVEEFANGAITTLAAKPVMLGSGTNLQRHCHWAIFVGVSHKFNDLIQSVHRIYRFLQEHEVTIDIVFSERETEVVKTLKTKWRQYNEMMERMAVIIRQFGLSSSAVEKRLERAMGVVRRSASGDGWVLVNDDTVRATASMESNSVGLNFSSWPFSTQYEYSPNYMDFGHTDDKAHFFAQADFLTPELYRTLMPGRVMAVHVKDRVRPGGYDNRSFQSIDPFHADVITHCLKHGFVYMGMITVVTDVVRENDQTYRLTWKMQREDGSRMGVGLPEYILLFRKPPTDNTRGYADDPIVKSIEEYSKGRWQNEADGYWRTSGDRLLQPSDLLGMPWNAVFQRFREYSLNTVYNHEHAVALAEAMDAAAQLPPDFKLLQLGSHHEHVWADVVRMRSLNTMQAQKGREKHLCPLPFDICDRVIRRFSAPGDLVFDPFNGLGTTTLRAIIAGRRGRGHELNPMYWEDSVSYHRAHDERASIPTLFDVIEDEPCPV